LNLKQQALFKRLTRLGEKLNNVCDDLKLNSLIVDLSKLSLSATAKPTRPIRKLKLNLDDFKNVKRATTKFNVKNVSK
jgi:hypothetical protein